jgi:S1-C subfamily serine protease
VPFKEILAKAGLDLSITMVKHADGGFESSTNFEGNEVVVSSVAAGGPAQLAGLRVGDALISVGGEPASDGVDSILSLHKPGDTVKIRFRREGQDREISVTLGSRTEQVYKVDELRGASDKQKRVREGMLKGTTN